MTSTCPNVTVPTCEQQAGELSNEQTRSAVAEAASKLLNDALLIRK